MAECEELCLAELLCARLCHDLAGAVGAVGTGAELISDGESDAATTREALALLADSAASAVARLRFLRLALGRGNAPISTDQLQQMVADFFVSPSFGDDRLKLDWRDATQRPWDPGAAKLLLNCVLLARDCLPRGGTVVLSAGLVGEVLIRVTAEGPLAAPAEAVAGLAANSAAELGPRAGQGYYTKRLATALGLTVNYKAEHDRVEFVAMKH